MHTTINSQKVEKVVWGDIYVQTYVILPTKVHVVKAVIFSIVIGLLVIIKQPLEKTKILVKIEANRRRGQQSMRCLDSITNSMDMNLSKFPGDSEGQGSLVYYSLWGHKGSDTT